MRRLCLILFFLLCTTIWPIWAQAEKPRGGEIALEGTIESLDVVKNTFTLRATSSTATSGNAKKLPQPKTQTIGLSNITQFLERSGIKNLSFADLEKGLSITVVGRQTTGKPLVARVVTWNAPAPLLPLDPLTPHEKAPFLPAPQTQKGIMLRIIDAGWMSPAQMWPGNDGKDRPLFYFSYNLPGESDGIRNSAGWLTSVAQRNTRLLWVSGPNGEPVKEHGSGLVEREGGVFGATRVAFSGVNPAWKSVIAEFETLDPSAPSDASGEFKSTHRFEKVPVPAKNGEKTEVIGQEVTTTHGTKIVLKSVRVERKEGEKGTTYFDFSVTAPSTVGDIKVSLDSNNVKNENGDAWLYTSAGGGSNQVHVEATPLEGDQFFVLSINVRESAHSLQKREWYRRFRMEVPVAALLKFVSPPADPPAWFLKTEGQAMSVEVEPEELGGGNFFGAMVWIKSRVPNTDKRQHWLVREVKAKEGSEETRGSTYEKSFDRPFMRLNGTPSTPDEYPTPIGVPFQKPTATFDLTLKVEKVHHLENFGSLKGVPLPAPGKSLEIREGQFENDSVRVKRLFWFKNGSELAGLSPESRGNFQNANLGVVVNTTPVFPGATVDIRSVRVQDDTGRSLDMGHWIPNVDLSQAGTQNTNLRTLLVSVPPSSKSLVLWFHTVETAGSGQIETVVLKGVTGKK